MMGRGRSVKGRQACGAIYEEQTAMASIPASNTTESNRAFSSCDHNFIY